MISKRDMFLRLSFIPFIFSSIPIVAGSVFYPEAKQVRKEIGRNTYSIGSYLISTIIFELCLYFVPFLIVSTGVYLNLGARKKFYNNIQNNFSFFELMWPGYLIFIGSLLFYMFLGSLTNSKKLTIFLLGLGLFCNMSALSELVSIIDQTGLIKKRFYFCIFDIFPSYLVTSILRKVLSETNQSELERSRIKKTQILEKILKDLKLPVLLDVQFSTELFIGVNSDPRWGLVLFTIICITYVALTLFCLTKQLSPRLRLVLSQNIGSNLDVNEYDKLISQTHKKNE